MAKFYYHKNLYLVNLKLEQIKLASNATDLILTHFKSDFREKLRYSIRWFVKSLIFQGFHHFFRNIIFVMFGKNFCCFEQSIFKITSCYHTLPLTKQIWQNSFICNFYVFRICLLYTTPSPRDRG